jgi:O-antigen/teichoic acid export membrane protein
MIIGTQVDRIVVMTIWDNATVGMYAVALTIAYSCLAVITESLHTVMFPKLASEMDAASRRTTLAKGLRHGVALIIPSALFLILLCPWLIPFLFGQAFGTAVPPAIALLLAYIPLALRQIGARGLRGLGDTRAGTLTESITLIVFLLTVWPLGHVFGLVGIGLALLLANIVSLAYLARYMSKHIGIEFTAWLTPQAWGELIKYARLYIAHVKSSNGR